MYDFNDPGHLAHEKLLDWFPRSLPEADADLRAGTSQQLIKFGYSVKDISPRFGLEVEVFSCRSSLTRARTTWPDLLLSGAS